MKPTIRKSSQSEESYDERNLIAEKYLIVWVLMATFVTTLSITVFVHNHHQSNKVALNEEGSDLPIQLPSVQTTASISNPKSDDRLNADEQGLTVVPQRKVDVERITLPRPDDKFALDLGGANSFSELEALYKQVAQLNPSLFRKLEPRGHFVETDDGLSVRLRVGPFISHAGAKKACSFVILPQNVNCAAAVFEGNALSAQTE